MTVVKARTKFYISDMQKAFIERRHKYPNELPEVSAEKAGYISKNLANKAAMLLRTDTVMAALEMRRSMEDASQYIDKDFVLLGLKVVFDRCMREGEVFEEIDGEYELVRIDKFKPKEATAALEMIAKIRGLMIQKVEVDDRSSRGQLTPEMEERLADVYDKDPSKNWIQ